MPDIDGKLPVKKNCFDPSGEWARCGQRKEFARYLRTIYAAVAIQLNTESGSLVGRRSNPDERGSPHARMLIKDTFARYAEQGFGGCSNTLNE